MTTALFDRSTLEGNRKASVCWQVGLEGEPSVPPLPLPPQQQMGIVMDEAGEKADWFLGLMDKVSYAS